MIANAGILVSEVVLVARKSRTAVERWVYTDVGKFSSLIETMDEARTKDVNKHGTVPGGMKTVQLAALDFCIELLNQAMQRHETEMALV